MLSPNDPRVPLRDIIWGLCRQSVNTDQLSGQIGSSVQTNWYTSPNYSARNERGREREKERGVRGRGRRRGREKERKREGGRGRRRGGERGRGRVRRREGEGERERGREGERERGREEERKRGREEERKRGWEEEGRGKREEGRGKREEGRGKREEGRGGAFDATEKLHQPRDRLSTNLGIQPGALAQQCARDEPETVADAELVLHHVIVVEAGVRVVPLVRTEARHHEHGEGDDHVGSHDVQPDLHGQWVHEAEGTQTDRGSASRRGAWTLSKDIGITSDEK